MDMKYNFITKSRWSILPPPHTANIIDLAHITDAHFLNLGENKQIADKLQTHFLNILASENIPQII